MGKSDMDKVNKMTGDYDAWLYERLQDKEVAYNHIQAAFEGYQQDQNREALLLAFKDVAKAQGGVGWLSKETKLNREHLYRLLSGKGNPQLETLNLILKAFGMHISIAMSQNKKSR